MFRFEISFGRRTRGHHKAIPFVVPNSQATRPNSPNINACVHFVFTSQDPPVHFLRVRNFVIIYTYLYNAPDSRGRR